MPRRVHSDRGSQLVKAAGNLDGLEHDFDYISSTSKEQTEWRFCPSGSQWRNGAIESFVKQFKWSLEQYKHTGLSYAEMSSVFKRIASVINSRPISARYGPRHGEADPDFLEMITPNMLLTARSGVDLPMRQYSDEDSPGKRLAYKEELERSWWEQWKIQCFDSLIPTKSWTQERRGVKPGDVVLISYSDKSKTGTYRLGLVESVETDSDGLVRTCDVRYRLVRSDLPAEELRFYYKGLKFKKLRVPVQRLCVILPVEEQNEPDFLRRVENLENKNEVCKEHIEDIAEKAVENRNDDCEVIGEISSDRKEGIEDICVDVEFMEKEDHEVEEELEDLKLNDPKQILARNFLIKNFRLSIAKKVKIRTSSRSVKLLHGEFSLFGKFWSNCQEDQ